MCGIAGIVSHDLGAAPDSEMLGAMLDAIAHRGPDGEGMHLDGPAALGHKRLAIIDLETGRQPMSNEDGSIWITFNGEIYNYVELRRELARHHQFRTHSDTEVILHLYEELGERCLERLNGMFAFAIWDSRRQRLFAARDRIGIKPFYWAMTDRALLFASEPKALLATGMVSAEPDSVGLEEYLTFQFCLGERTLFRDIRKLEPGHYLTFRPGRDRAPADVCYWDYNYELDFHHTEDYYREQLVAVLNDAIRLQLRSDVPVGAHCSGGIDSSTVVSLAARHYPHTFKTFTGAFREGPQYDETRYARAVAENVNAHYHEVWPSAREFADTLPWLIYMMDEPAAGPGLFPQYAVSKLARDHVKVVLGGQGGDELFGGYARYLVAYLEQALKGAIYGTGSDPRYVVTWDSIEPSLGMLKQYRPMLQGFFKDGLFEEMDRRYFRLVSRIEDAESLISGDVWGPTAHDRMFQSYAQIFNNPSTKSYFNKMTNFDLKTLLPALLQVEDRTSMSVSLESRVPLLDHRIAELVTRMPPAMRFKGGDSKRIFREAVQPFIPDVVFSRRDKMGFPVPLTEWLHGPIREFVGDVLLSDRARQRGVYRIGGVERLLAGEAAFGRQLWGLLSLELWFRAFVDGEQLPRRRLGSAAAVVS
ncbi:MAG: asparagine synthase (glutamine-hydrolyzing) [Gemmatimonadetes bacterium SCN 70-22]|nr:MAG: asparagine synthase (glutamine-hydrolyzing) [Gemmatimonadetes bacterium SCN 70-22]